VIGHTLAYLFGALIGEVMLWGWWLNSQMPGASLRHYAEKKKGQIVLSACVSALLSLIWAEGGLINAVHEWIGGGVEFSLGLSLVVGGAIAFFAHGIVSEFSKHAGVDTPKGD